MDSADERVGWVDTQNLPETRGEQRRNMLAVRLGRSKTRVNGQSCRPLCHILNITNHPIQQLRAIQRRGWKTLLHMSGDGDVRLSLEGNRGPHAWDIHRVHNDDDGQNAIVGKFVRSRPGVCGGAAPA